MPKPRQSVCIEATLSKDHDRPNGRAQIPAAVRDYFEGTIGDKLIFETGCDRSVTAAALKGPYLVVRLERAGKQAPPAPVEIAKPTAVEPFEDSVRRKMNEQREAGSAGILPAVVRISNPTSKS